jgi:hypothetical protein
MNQWGSAEKGRGKACKNVRHLALIPAVNEASEVEGAELAVLKLPVMSVANWSNYVDKCAALYRRPPLGMITVVSTVPDAKSQFRVVFNAADKVNDGVLGAVFAREESARRVLEREYEPNTAPAAPVDNGKKKKF